MSNPKNASWYNGGGMAGAMLPGAGQVFYVWGRDGGIGDDTNDGLSPETPVKTLTAAVALCTDDAQDYIVVMTYSAPTGETWPISVDKETTHIIGAMGGGWPVPYLTPPGDTAALSIAHDKIHIAHLNINGGATHGCIENDPAAGAARWGLCVEDCMFGVIGAGQDGIRNVAAGDMPYLTVKRCTFGVGLTRDGIRIEHNATRSKIGMPWGDGNLFDQVPGVAVNVVGAAVQVGVFHNTIAVPANTAGGAITLGAGVAGCEIFGNRANFGDTTMGNVPYTDGAGAGANHWGDNYQGITLVMPT